MDLDRVTVVIGSVILAGIVIVGLVVPPPDENRELTTMPSAEAALLLEDGALTQGADALEDASGLRAVGVRADGWLRREVIGERIFDKYVRGDGDWLYYRSNVEGACARREGVEDLRRVVARLQTVGRAAGLEVVVVLPPNKVAVHVDEAGDFGEEARCARTQARAFDTLEPGAVTGLEAILGSRTVAGPAGPAYFTGDTHWRHAAAAEASRAVFAVAAPELVPDLVLEQIGTSTQRMDLELFAGRSVDVQDTVWALRPPGATAVAIRDLASDVSATESRGGSVEDRDVVLVLDSFGSAMLPSLSHLGTRTVICDCDARVDGRIAPYLADAELLVIESVQRNARLHLIREDQAGQLAGALGARLSGEDLAVGPDGAIELPDSGLVLLTFDGTPTGVRLLRSDGSEIKELAVREGVVSGLFVDDLDVSQVVVDSAGARVTGARAVELG